MNRTVLVLLALGVTQVHGQGVGHRITASQVIVDRASHWNNWSFPVGTLQISPLGEIRPNRLDNDINASLDIVDFLQLHPPEGSDKEPDQFTIMDAIQAGSNAGDVANILDGDPSTYWQPEQLDAGKPVSDQWWFTVDLGRYVLSDRIVLRFAEDADPFLLFDVLVSDGRRPASLPLAPDPEFRPVLRLFTPNKSQREFEIELPSSDELPGQGIRFVQVVVTGSDSSRAEEVGETEYQRLLAEKPALAGAIDYHKRQTDGRQILVDAEVYEQLDADSRGQVLYFRREVPRLAELEVWALGDEILMGTKARGGEITESDGNIRTSVLANGEAVSLATATVRGPSPPLSPEGFMRFDLGSFYWIDRQMILYLSTGTAGKFPDYRLEFSDGSRAADGSVKWVAAVTRQHNPDFVIGHEYNVFEPIKARFFRFLFLRIFSRSSGFPVNVAEMHLYGRGYQPEVTLESDLIRLGGSRNLLSIEWDADTPVDTEVVMQTRTGNELDIIKHYFKQLNPALPRTEVDSAAYEGLRESWKAGIEEEEQLGSDWSDWSEPYRDPTGSVITSPSPRQFVKIRASLLSADPDRSAALRSARLSFIEPVAQRLLGEITPFAMDSLGVQRTLSLYVRPEFAATDPGFDELLLTGPSDMAFGFVHLYAGRVRDFDMEDPDLEALRVADVQVLPTGADSLQLAFDSITPASSIEVLRLDFSTALFSGGAQLRASLQRRVGGGWQRVDPGDALEGVASNTTTLIGQEESRRTLFTDVTVLQPVFTPNGDGINDETIFSFTVLRVSDDSQVEVQLYDVSSRNVRQLIEQRSLASGRYEIGWDGRNDEGRIVAPGLYIARIRVRTDTDGTSISNNEILRTVAVAY